MKPSLVILMCLVGASCVQVHERGGRSGEYLQAPESLPFAVVAGEYDERPVFQEGKAPVFPLTAYYERIDTGEATLRFWITVDGRVREPKVISATHPQFAAGVAHVMPSWRFVPAKHNGVAVEVQAATSIQFGTEAAKYKLRESKPQQPQEGMAGLASEPRSASPSGDVGGK